MDFNRGEVEIYYRSRMKRVVKAGAQLRGPCPIHSGKDDNFSVEAETGLWTCHSQCGRSGDMISLEMELGGLDFVKAKAETFRIVGRPLPNWKDRDIEATYDYTDAAGSVLYQVVRKVGKKFMQRRPVNGKWQWGLGNVEPVPFRLQDFAAAKVIACVEGERDVLNLRRAGWVATCNNGGAGNFKPALVPHFAGKHVAIFPDNDEPGRKHAEAVAGLLAPVAASVRIVEIPDLPLKGDVSDYLASGKTGSDLRALWRETETWTPEFEFSSIVPHENDRYLRTFGQAVKEAGGYDAFWKGLEIDGLPTPFPSLTRKLGGLRPGEVYVIGARTGQGKTSMVLQFADTLLERKTGVLIFSMEMSHVDAFQRLAAIRAGVDLSQYRYLKKCDPVGAAAMDAALRKSTDHFSKSPLYVTTKTGVTTEFLVAEAKRVKDRANIGLVIIDHMQLMGSTGKLKSDYEKFTAISRTTKEIASELKVPLILVSQVSRSNASEKRTELEMSDLRGCLDKASLVLLADGRRKQIKDVAAGDVILGVDEEHKFKPATVERCWCTGEQETYKIKTRFGREIVATANHPFLKPSGWGALDELKPGNRIAGVFNAPVDGVCSDRDAALARFAGYMVGNGSYIVHRGISFTTPDADVMGDFTGIVSTYFPEITIRVEKFENHYELDLVRILDNGYGAPGKNPIRNWMIENGISGRFDQKRVPKFVFGLGNRGAAEFVSGYLMTDGCIKEGRSFSTCFDTTSPKLAKDVQHLLCRLGVAATVGNPTMNSASTVPMYRLAVVRQSANTIRLLSGLTLFGKNRRKADKCIAAFADKGDKFSHLLSLPQEYSIAVSRADWRLWRNTDKGIGRDKCRDIGEQLGNPQLTEWANSDILWDTIETIEPNGPVETWDMRVPGIHNFTANDFVVHNSGAIEEDAAGIMLLYYDAEDFREAKLDPTGARLKRGPIKTWLKLAKNRFGVSGTYEQLQHMKAMTRFEAIHDAQAAA